MIPLLSLILHVYDNEMRNIDLPFSLYDKNCSHSGLYSAVLICLTILLVCQEAIWEAFRIFLDRVPNSEEYKHWTYACQHGSLCLDEVARNFSSTQEHIDMVARVSTKTFMHSHAS